MADIHLQNARKEYGDVVAVRGIDLAVEDGSFVVIVGPSGCGKSTTLRLVAGLESITDGDIRKDGESLVGVEPKNRNVAMVFQNYALYPHMTAKRNMTFGLGSAGDFNDEEIERRVQEAADLLDIDDLLDRKPEALSGGERQRVALGRAIIRDPDVFLMDEPLSNLDAKLRIRMRAELAKLHEQLRTTTVYVTHDQTEAMTLGDEVVVMNDGEIQQVDSPQRLYDYPANRFVAEFIGDPAMNTLGVTVERDEGYRAVHSGFQLPLPAADSLEDIAGSQAVLGVRPEDLSLADADAFEATVTVTEPLGNSLLLECRVGDETVRVQASPRSDAEPGDSVALTHDPERLHLFDRETGRAVYHSATAAEAGPAEGRVRTPADGGRSSMDGE
ncbi:glycerol-3-phosphate ABC transporter ATP-binding protein [Halobacteriales archaeon QS_1_68_44]|nr:MAG: glycerol-3-phosphate ABC transporter ATP-binding protein [Halobacteriales archaeon QS_1_68_44]